MTTWRNLMAVAAQADTMNVLDPEYAIAAAIPARLDALTDLLLDNGTNTELRDDDWDAYWQNIADAYVERYGDPTQGGTA